MFSTTEITSHEDVSDNVIHQRLFFPYKHVAGIISGKVLEVGCGAGRGLQLIAEASEHLTGIDKNQQLLDLHQKNYPRHAFLQMNVPPFTNIPSNHFDYVVSFQVIEHIEDDHLFTSEIHRVLKPGGKAFITTPNSRMSLTRNPWHVREYTPAQLEALMRNYFQQVDLSGITGNQMVMDYYQKNKASVAKITRFDIFDLQHKLPRSVLQIPYDLLNRLNRKALQRKEGGLVEKVSVEDYFLSAEANQCFDLFCVATK